MGGPAARVRIPWLPYFCVHNTDAAVTAAQDNGGSVLQEAHDSEFGRQAVLADGDGAVFSVIQAHARSAPRGKATTLDKRRELSERPAWEGTRSDKSND